ncbi:type 4b pilus protein PilO2 [Pseudomonas sp. DCB_CB]|uniref:type 4b pilus protein PilO2 n=1 Tax=unclassified Pseudomonas TaxID=196821 RepID=UPI0022498FE2|nr:MULTISPECIES: type 4b pilus protein PilO2 [unclassified Pseudomonas]MCX2694511.1 type 4b pilus protein PilO2 [Pseudomonas sp. DCB_BZ]MCX2859659.1 type 4b pilus protein PilO2 [Pseudomonas sp. DCB_CB]
MSERPEFLVTSVTIAGNTFVSGLWWKSLKKLNGYMKEARELGKDHNMDIVSIRKGNRLQGGFVKKEQGVMKGMYSLAHAVAGQFKDEASWIAVFRLPDDRYAMVAAKDDLVLPGCDVIGEKEQIYKHYRDKCKLFPFRFDGRYIPEDLNDGGTPVDIEDILQPKRLKSEYKLKPLFFGLSKKEILVSSGVAFIALALAMGGLQWKAHLDREKAIAEAKRLIEEQRKLEELARIKGKEQNAEVLRHPWTTQPSFKTFVDSCTELYGKLPLAYSGWTFESAHCDTVEMSALYARNGNSTIDDFNSATASEFETPASFLKDGNSAQVGERMLTVPGGDDSILIQSVALAMYGSHLQRLGIVGSLELVPYVAPQPDNSLPGAALNEDAQPQKPDWSEYTWAFDTQLEPKIVLAGLEFPGMRVTEITVSTNNSDSATELRWTIKGQMYAR